MNFIACLALLVFAMLAGCTDVESDERVARLEAYDNSAPIKLDSQSYNLITAPGRKYGIYILHTALADQHNCKPCRYVSFEARSLHFL